MKCILLILAFAAAPVLAADSSPDEIRGLIAQLGDADYGARETAFKKLKAIGKPALPFLKEATKDEDAEIASRAQNLIKKIQVPPLPGGQIDPNSPAPVIRMRVAANLDGSRTLEIVEPTREIEISNNDDGIKMKVRATAEPREQVEYIARDEDDLKQQNKDAHELYTQYASGGPGLLLGGGNFALNGPGAVIQLRPQRDELMDLRRALDRQMEESKTVEKDREQIAKALDELAAARINGDMTQYTKVADEARKTIESFKLDAGTFLPPPAKTRLGVSVGNDLDMLRIDRVQEASRAEKIGIKAGDIIKTVDGKKISTVAELRKAVSAKEKDLVVEVVRDGEAMKLEEKE